MSNTRAPWPPAIRIAFRFFFVLLGLSALKMLATFSPFGALGRPYWFVWKTILYKLSPLVFRITPVGTLQGSDSLTAWLLQLWTLTFAVIAALTWTFLSHASEHGRLLDAQRTWVRYATSCAMLGYGLSKVFCLQFWRPTPTDLIQTFAGSSPFALMWRFTGYSSPYQFFGGVLEVSGALLLLWRRTTTLGAIIIVGVMTNVVMLNFCYQIPVKNFSMELLLLASWLLVPEARRLWAALSSRDVPPPAPLRPFPLPRRIERARLVVKALWLVGIVGVSVVFGGMRAWRRHHAATPAFWGAYDVESFTVAGVSPPPSAADSWRQVAFGANWSPAMAIVTGDGDYHLFDMQPDAAHGTVKLADPDLEEDPKPQSLSVKVVDAAHLEIDGTFNGKPVQARLRQRDLSRATLEREFHWVDDGGYFR
ncbi:MAG TPA: hypothetical protein VIA18_33330 [Polyangia bacterium]|jgi:hypothetical protein|nr:hypothetical protein [Polyangia bacterium]